MEEQPVPVEERLARPAIQGRPKRLKVASLLFGVASLVAFLLLHTAMGWVHLLLLPLAVYLLVDVLLTLRLSRVLSPTQITRHRYDRIAPLYDLLDATTELRARRWRRDLWRRVEGRRVLEIGVGTGKNLPYHPPATEVVAVDLSPAMLARARRRAARLGSPARLEVADAQSLPFADGSFDTVVATFVFCSVPDPLLGLREARRVLAPGGHLLLLEHVLSERLALRRLMKWLDPLPAHLWGAHINRETASTVREAGFQAVEETDLSLDIVKYIVARRGSERDSRPTATTNSTRADGLSGELAL